jgi:uncharacterized membrane protein YtjA (UPF0391 family)
MWLLILALIAGIFGFKCICAAALWTWGED